jgi:5-methyltetrahydropteroyltriglutamate--homocysteine methyltransferase
VITSHSDVVGSLLRPPELLEARNDHESGSLSHANFKAAEDRAVDAAVKLQEEAGLEVVTDGEMRRLSFQSQVPASIDGFGRYDINAFLWGDWNGAECVGPWTVKRPGDIGVVAKLKRRRYLSTEEFVYLRAHTTRTAKITIPSPSLWSNFWSAEFSKDVYPTIDSFLADVVDLLRDEVRDLGRLGATYIQIDAPHYTAMLEEKTRAFYEGQGWTADRWLSQGIEMDNAVIDSVPGITFGFHL